MVKLLTQVPLAVELEGKPRIGPSHTSFATNGGIGGTSSAHCKNKSAGGFGGTGAWVSTTLIVWVQLEVLPHSSVAVKVTSVTANGSPHNSTGA